MSQSPAARLARATHDEKYQRRVAEALDEACERIREREKEQGPPEDLEAGAGRYIVFSDQHKGARNGADDFRHCERAYNAALAYYFARGYTLVELGDVEELWEERPGSVIEHYEHSLKLSADFQKAGRYRRIFGNHDDAWSFAEQVKKHLHPIYGDDLKVHEGLRLRVVDEGRELGHILLLHGHQGTGTSDRFSRWSRLPVRYVWRPVQRLFKVSLNTPAKDWVLREKHNVAMYKWADRQERLVLIAGHTHRPVFRSRTHEAKVEEQLRAAEQALLQAPDDEALRLAVAELSAELEWVRAQEGSGSGPTGEVVEMSRPCYFNTGCCSFVDGDITGLEIAEGEIRLVRWPDDRDQPRPQVLARARLAELFDEIAKEPNVAERPVAAGG